MPYKTLEFGEIDTSIVYVSSKELMKRLGIARSTLNNHIHRGWVEALRFRHRTYFHPEESIKYEALFRAGLLGKGK